MDAVVLAGGYATRLWPITRHRPKMFLPVGDSTVIDRIFTELEADGRIEDVYVSTNERFADDFRDHLGDAPFEKPQLSVEGTTAEGEKPGVVGALGQLVEREGVTDDMMVIAGDNLISFAVSDFLDAFYERETPTVAAYDVGSRERAKAYGVLDLDGDRVVEFEEKPDDPDSSLVSIACYAFPADALPMIDEYLADDNNPDEPGWLIQWLQHRRPVHAFRFEEAWFDIGTPGSYLDAVAWSLDGDTRIEEGAIVEDATLGETVHVMDGAEVVDSTLERAVVFPGATVRDCDLQESIVDEETYLENLDLSGALVGAHTRIPNDG